jgi:hypothetical protein
MANLTAKRSAKIFEAEVNSRTSGIEHTFRAKDVVRKTLTKELSSRASKSVTIIKQAQMAFFYFGLLGVSFINCLSVV